MEKRVVFTAMIALMIILSPEVKSQQVKVDVKGKVIQQTDSRANQRTDQAISYGFDKLEQGIAKGAKSVFRKKDKTEGTGEAEGAADEAAVSTESTGNDVNQQVSAKETVQEQSTLTWSKYDFVPGDEVIFEDNLQGEENGEFPSRWDLYRGNVEIAEFGGEKVIMFREGGPSIVPYFKDPAEDHLPDVFTVELDYYYPSGNLFEIFLYDWKNQRSTSPTGYTSIRIWGNEMTMGTASSSYPDGNKDFNRWIHISIAYTNGKLKVYMDDTRLINIPRIDFDPSGLTIHVYHASNENLCYVKNVRIAKGGVKYYDRVMQDGKIIVNGIKFDTGKSTLKPESMGPINEIFKLMKDNPDLKFSVEGHTDSQGDDASNMKLSEERAKTVSNTLIEMGISSDRLTSKGWGESKPISNNASPEDMANNRRVEFVKI
jgi:outer membrane protein OmpA-like peptidoglycan-associated protein